MEKGLILKKKHFIVMKLQWKIIYSQTYKWCARFFEYAIDQSSIFNCNKKKKKPVYLKLTMDRNKNRHQIDEDVVNGHWNWNQMNRTKYLRHKTVHLFAVPYECKISIRSEIVWRSFSNAQHLQQLREKICLDLILCTTYLKTYFKIYLQT